VSGTAIYGSDYTVSGAVGFSSNGGAVQIPALATTASLLLHPIADADGEGEETITFTVYAYLGAKYTVAANQAVVATSKILDLAVRATPTACTLPARMLEPGLLPAPIPMHSGEPLLATSPHVCLAFQTCPHHPSFPLGMRFSPFCFQGNVTVTTAVDTTPETDSTSSPLAFTFKVDSAVAADLTIRFNLSGTATFGVDYQPSGGYAGTSCSADGKGCMLTVAAGSDTASVYFEALGDTLFEMDESVVVTLVPGLYMISSPNSATGLIQDDDAPVGLADGRSHLWPSPGMAERAGAPGGG
jgi:hypothetical protein